jgi:hypothetical protein
VPLGSDTGPSISITGDANTGIYSPGADQLAITTGGVERARLDGSGRLLVGHTDVIDVGAAIRLLQIYATGESVGLNAARFSADASPPTIALGKSRGTTVGSQVAVVDGDVLGQFSGYGSNGTSFNRGTGLTFEVDGTVSTTVPGRIVFSTRNAGGIIAERLRIDNSGRLLSCITTARTNIAPSITTTPQFQFEGTTGDTSAFALIRSQNNSSAPQLLLAKTRSTSAGGVTAVIQDDTLGLFTFQGADGTNFYRGAEIKCEVDGTVSSASMPGRLIFSTTASSSGTPTERFRISSTGAQSSVIPGGSTLYPVYDCRAWVNFNGTGTFSPNPSTTAIRASGNVSSITKNGTGDYTVNFTTAMADANYSVVCGGRRASGTLLVTNLLPGGTYTTSAVQVNSASVTPANIDSDYFNVSVFR